MIRLDLPEKGRKDIEEIVEEIIEWDWGKRVH